MIGKGGIFVRHSARENIDCVVMGEMVTVKILNRFGNFRVSDYTALWNKKNRWGRLRGVLMKNTCRDIQGH